ncbi:Sec-independent protein translocase subunit TatA [Streptomyces sp. NPDC091279]|uniref:Sec-independent protein translocase subunit TatA n=1 Tax=unclassified Streptomyces TaxID=2593676 RepID=UPI0038113F63
MLRNGLEPWHLLIVALVVIVLFGSKKLPEAARGLGKSMRILKSEAKAMKEDDAVQHPAPTAENAADATVRAVQAPQAEQAAPRPATESSTAAH